MALGWLPRVSGVSTFVFEITQMIPEIWKSKMQKFGEGIVQNGHMYDVLDPSIEVYDFVLFGVVIYN